jgi:hypothetical protein
MRRPEVVREDMVLLHPGATSAGWRGALAGALKLPTSRKFELDAVGLFVWEACDGKTTVAKIGAALQKEFKLHRAEADASLRAFLKLLAERGLITMEGA